MIRTELIRHTNGDLTEFREQDVDPIRQQVLDQQVHRGFSATRDLQHVAEIPLIIVEKWKNELGVDVFNKDHWPKVKRLLNDPDYRDFKITQGSV